MPQCKCPRCSTTFNCSSSRFGKTYCCRTCGFSFKLDVVHLARYRFPQIIEIHLVNEEGRPFTDFQVPVFIDYGYYVPPLLPDADGRIVITKEIMEQAKNDHRSTGIMDYKYDDYSLNRFIALSILGEKESSEKAKGRFQSGWPITSLEKQLYGEMKQVALAYGNYQGVRPLRMTIDLSEDRDIVTIDIPIIIFNLQKAI